MNLILKYKREKYFLHSIGGLFTLVKTDRVNTNRQDWMGRILFSTEGFPKGLRPCANTNTSFWKQVSKKHAIEIVGSKYANR